MNWPQFHHEAMATTFSVIIDDARPDYARQAAGAAFKELDRLEGELSRFIESSDIARASRLGRDESIVIGDDALRCLLLAEEVTAATGGAFDAAYASKSEADLPVGSPRFSIDPSMRTLVSHVDRLQLDLGAIGKGYALDRMADVLGEWSLTSVCLQSGGSTVLAVAPPCGESGWPVQVGDGAAVLTLPLSHSALSASGLAVRGPHLIDPISRAAASRQERVWAQASSAALSDALSTAFFVFDDERIQRFCADHPEIGAAVCAKNQRLVSYGCLKEALSNEA